MISEERLRNTRAWAAARVGQMSGAEVIVAACDEALAARQLTSADPVGFVARHGGTVVRDFSLPGQQHPLADGYEWMPVYEHAATIKPDGDGWEDNARYLLDRCPHTLRVREGGGPEDLKRSFVLTFTRMERELEQLAKDAQRYQWLRNRDIEKGTFPRPGIFIGRTMPDEVLTGEEADKDIDFQIALETVGAAGGASS